MGENITPHIYIDTNIILDVIGGRRRSSIHLLETIKEDKIKCCTSHFSLMEALAIRQEYAFIRKKLQEEERLDKLIRNRHDRTLSGEELEAEYEKIYNLFFIHYEKYVDYWYLTRDGWALGIDIMTKLNISAADAIHVATALEAKCDNFISSDETLIKRANKLIKSYLPDNFLKNKTNIYHETTPP